MPAFLEPWPARYGCCACGHEWLGTAGPTLCPACRCRYVYWVDYPGEHGNATHQAAQFRRARDPAHVADELRRSGGI